MCMALGRRTDCISTADLGLHRYQLRDGLDQRGHFRYNHAQVSTGVLRKFMGGLDIPLSLFEASATPDRLVCHVAPSPLRIVRAMAQHRSQWVWCVMVACHDGFAAAKKGELVKHQACRQLKLRFFAGLESCSCHSRGTHTSTRCSAWTSEAGRRGEMQKHSRAGLGCQSSQCMTTLLRSMRPAKHQARAPYPGIVSLMRVHPDS
jgi:hypothetical protein